MEVQGQRKSWFGRNWGWAVPLGGCLTMIVIAIVFFGAVFFGVSKAFTGSTPYQDGLEKAKEDPYVLELLGTPVETNGMMGGSIKVANDSGTAEIAIPIKGPKGTAVTYVVGTKKNGEWTYDEMYVIVEETGEQIDLLGYEDTDKTIKE